MQSELTKAYAAADAASFTRPEDVLAMEDFRGELEFTMSVVFPDEVSATNDAVEAAVEPDKPRERASAASPVAYFHPWHSRLPKVSAQEVRGSVALATVPLPLLQQVTAALKNTLARFCRAHEAAVAMRSTHVQEASLPWSAPASEWLLFVTFSLAPERAPITMVLDATFALALIDYSLGGNGAGEAARALSVTERAIFEFILLQLLQGLQQHLAAPVFVLEQVAVTPPQWLQEAAFQRFLNARVSLRVKNALGMVEIKASSAALGLLQQYQPHFTSADAIAASASEKLQQYVRFLPELRASLLVGKVEISVHDLAELACGDIVLLKQTKLAWQQQQLTGEFCVQAGGAGQIFFTGPACLPAADSGMQMQFASFHLSATPFVSQGVSMSDANFGNYFAESAVSSHAELTAATPAPANEGGYDLNPESAVLEEVVNESLTGLGRTIDGLLVTLQVELTTRRLPLQELAQLREGQIIDLGCHATDLVNILVDGRTIARGDLVEFDGQIGVRITEIAV
ncbi:MAG: FliM/FliN family flagellar motor switch protein [Blastocatellia bacterium]